MDIKSKLSKYDSSPRVDSTYYMQLVESLLYLTNTRPYLSYVVGVLSRFSQAPHKSHWDAALKVLRFVKGTLHTRIHYSSGCELMGFTDSDWGGDIDDWQSTSGFCFSLGSGLVSWSSKK